MPLATVAEYDIPEIGKIRIQSDIDLLQKGIRQLNKRGVPRAFKRAGTKSLSKTRTRARVAIRERFNLPANLVNRQITSKNDSGSGAYIQGRGGRIPIIKVKGKATQKRLGVSINTGTGRRIIKHAFIAKVGSHTGVFKRTHKTGSKRVSYRDSQGKLQNKQLPIRELTFPPLGIVLTSKRQAGRLFRFYTRDFPLQLRKQLNLEFDKAGGRRRGF